MRSLRKLFIAAGVAALFASAPAVRAQQQPNMDELMKAMGAIMGAGTNAAVAVVDFRELKALLPAELPGMKRTAASGEKNSAMGMTVAVAEGSYEGGDSSVNIKITDMGGTGTLMGMAAAGWAMSEIDKETDTGYERTTTIDGNKAHEEYDTDDKSGETQVLVGGRFLVEVDGNSVTPEQLKSAVSKIDLKKLAGLKPAAPK
jgi:hypothetical protein